jgi:toxin ParE1/3/4
MPRASRSLIWSPEAEQDLFDISSYLTTEASATTADKYLRKIGRACERVRSRPLTGRARGEVMPGLRSVLVHPYVVIYRVTASSVDVIRVLHQRRDVDAIFADRE